MERIPTPVLHAIEPVTGKVRDVAPVGGGCIAHATRIDTQKGCFFLKWGSHDVAVSFSAEADGLRTLKKGTDVLLIPDVLYLDEACLLLEWVEPGRTSTSTWEALGRGLAELHQRTGPSFGYPRDNFLGRTPQENGWVSTWPAFFVERRFVPQVRRARASRQWNPSWDALIENIYGRLESWLPESPPPGLVHGDLWSGNQMVSQDGRPVLFDPAVYYGHTETDLAMTRLFGGFHERFYSAYFEINLKRDGYAERFELYNLYHLINHLNLFGHTYAGGVARILKRYG